MNIYKLLAGILLTIFLVEAGPHIAVKFGLISPLKDKAWLILLITASSLAIKSLISDVVAGEFLFHKFGYDNCLVSFSATLTALGLQLASKDDLFTGLSTFVLLADIPAPFPEPAANRSLQLFVFLLLALTGTLLTAAISGAIKRKQAKGQDFLSLFNSIIGAALLALYVVILITKSE